MTHHSHAALTVLCALACAAPTSAAWARRITLNDTGMTQCIDHQKQWSSECAKSRQDAADGRDASAADPHDGEAGFSFRKVCRSGQMAGEGSCPADPGLGTGPDDWGCTYDDVTQLTWETKTSDGGTHDGNHFFTNRGGKASDDEHDAAWLAKTTNEEALCGATNWRLPDALELQSIVNYGAGTPNFGAPLIDHNFFPNSFPWQTWTRTQDRLDAKSLWHINFQDGGVGLAKGFDARSVRLVHRVDQAATMQVSVAGDRFVPSPDGTEVADNLTGLIWRRCPAGMVWNDGTRSCTGSATEFSWVDALDYAAANRQGGWRIPNAKELLSIVDFTTASPAIDRVAFPNTPTTPSFLSSTPFDDAGLVNVQVVSFFRGAVAQVDAYSTRWPLRLVRRGRK